MLGYFEALLIMRKIVLFFPNLDIGHAKAIIMPVTVFHFPETASIAQTKHTVYTPIAAIPEMKSLVTGHILNGN